MKFKTAIILLTLLTIICFCYAAGAAATDEKNAPQPDAAAAAAQANNPLANMVAFNIQNYYIGELTESDENANQLWLRYAQPFSIAETGWLVRASLPVNTYPTPPDQDHETGLGDFNVFAAYLFDMPNPALSVGLGPLLTAPTATEDYLGSKKWSAGFAQIIFDARNRKFQYGYLLTWQASFAGDDDRDNVNVGALQPFGFYQLGGGTYLRTAPIWAYDFESDNYNIPLGLGIGQVIKKGNKVFNFFVEPQWTVAYDGPGWPEWSIFFALNMQFLGK
ncbi:MAG: hypothetical protein ABFS43_06175 [Thermodesulfobacteriota bacterium]